MCAGTYFLQGFDSTIDVNGNNCSFFEEFIINEPEEISINFDVVGSCFNEENGVIDLTVTGGTGIYTYSWSNGDTSEDLNNLAPGIYTITVIDENSCTQSEEIEVIEFEELIITETHSDYNGFGVSCNGAIDGFIDITVTGGSGIYTYLWSSGQNTEDLNNIGAGAYTITVTDENGCSEEITVEITEPDPLIISETHSDFNGFGVSCNGATDGTIDITVEGGVGEYTYSWSSGQTTEDLNNIGAGTYTVTATDENGCQIDITVEITEPDELTISETHSDYSGFGVSCNGATDGSIDITVNGGTGVYTYLWSSGQNTEDLNNIGVGTYTVTATDENGCSEEITVEITEPDELTISETHSDYNGFGVSCNGATDGFIDVTVNGGTGVYTYLWSSGQNTEDLNNIGAGTYTVTATDENGCSEEITVEITEPDPLIITEVHSDFSGFGVTCNGGSDGFIDVTIEGGSGVFDFSWSSGQVTEDISNIGADIHFNCNRGQRM